MVKFTDFFQTIHIEPLADCVKFFSNRLGIVFNEVFVRSPEQKEQEGVSQSEWFQ